jgi:hypothetical protein
LEGQGYSPITTYRANTARAAASGSLEKAFFSIGATSDVELLEVTVVSMATV